MPKTVINSNGAAVSARLAEYAQAVTDNTDALVAHLSIAIVEDVVEDTPLDTGLARSGWNATKGGPVFLTDPDIINEEAVVSRAETQIGKVAKIVDITNGVPYIGQLNDGSSTQAPAGFVRAAVTKAIVKLNGIQLLKRGSSKKL